VMFLSLNFSYLSPDLSFTWFLVLVPTFDSFRVIKYGNGSSVNINMIVKCVIMRYYYVKIHSLSFTILQNFQGDMMSGVANRHHYCRRELQ
jgi:ABC-type Na+ efflux pump permease subunit